MKSTTYYDNDLQQLSQSQLGDSSQTSHRCSGNVKLQQEVGHLNSVVANQATEIINLKQQLQFVLSYHEISNVKAASQPL